MYLRNGLGDLASAALLGGPISAGVSLATSAAALWLGSIQLSHAADTATTQIVNGLEPLLRANVAAYLNGPGTCADQAAALAAFDTAWVWLTSPQACGAGSFGSAGNRCISDRGPGGKFPWFTWYRDPIANDPRAAQCAAQLALDNPNAAEQSAIQNIQNLATGSRVQTTPGMFDTSSGSVPSALNPMVSSPIFTAAFAGIPIWLWIVGAVLLAVLV